MISVFPSEQPRWFLNTLVDILASFEASPARVSLLRHQAPFGDSPPLHIHRSEIEIFHVLEGRFRFQVGDDGVDVSPGEVLFAPAGIPHTYCVESREGGRWLTITNSGDFEKFVREFSRQAESRALPPPMQPSPESAAALADACRAYNIDIVGPPLAPR